MTQVKNSRAVILVLLGVFLAEALIILSALKGFPGPVKQISEEPSPRFTQITNIEVSDCVRILEKSENEKLKRKILRELPKLGSRAGPAIPCLFDIIESKGTFQNSRLTFEALDALNAFSLVQGEQVMNVLIEQLDRPNRASRSRAAE